MIAISPSLGHKEISKSSEVEKYLRDISSKTNESKRSWEIIKPELSKFRDADPRKIADTIIVLAKTKGEEIHKELNRLYEASRDDKLIYKYGSCSKNYNDANRNLYLARRDIELKTDRNIPIQINDTFEELNSCELQFDNDSFDPAHIRDRNREFRVYLQIVKVATDGLLKKN
ncbi:hypothetical protein PHJA_003029800 [Phtheirospermum japonicum]|uniref:Uncharacterized protein n=1 Tax=Phtheirospermum japonicum TaxID=374723 RepID=A0A830D8I1_9LAMI|nr:hypothetical protein PHJA_003029800 [Phtheirospermum japonicum]